MCVCVIVGYCVRKEKCEQDLQNVCGCYGGFLCKGKGCVCVWGGAVCAVGGGIWSTD